MEIAVTIYEKTIQGLLSQINKLSPYFSYFQIDISDGIYAPNKTISVDEALSCFESRVSSFKHLTFDFHLMVTDYESEVKKLTDLRGKINIGNILIHYSLHPSISYLLNLKSSWGLVLNSQDQVSDLVKDYELQKIPIVQIMTVEIGAQGNPFLLKNINKIEQLKKVGFGGKIFIDGGINDQTLPLFLSQKYQPDILCPGSYLTQATQEELPKRVKYLKNLCPD